MSERHCPLWLGCLDISACVKCWTSGERQPARTRPSGLGRAALLFLALSAGGLGVIFWGM